MALPFKLMVTVRLLQVIWTSTTFLQMIFAVLKNPLKAFRKKTRSIPPACLIDPSLGAHEYVTANGIKFHYVTAGDKTKPLMLFLHGFPEFWFSWRYQLREFCTDYHVVAVDMRGYGDSDKPSGVNQYSIDILKEDVVQLIKVLGSGKCILVAHDWGGVIAWRVAHRHPELIEKFIVLNCPHPKVYTKSLSTGWSQMSKSWYIFMFQTPWLPECILSLRDFGMFKAMYRGKKSGLRNLDNFSDDVLEAFKYTFSQKGALTPTINYHRNVFNIGERTPGPFKPLEVPTLLLWGEEDVFLDISLVDQHRDVCANITIHRIPQCSHWVQQDCPELTNKHMREFLESRQ